MKKTIHPPDELIALGRKMARNPSAVATNIEGYALRAYHTDEAYRQIALTGCCGGKADCDGHCWAIGFRCPLLDEVGRLERFARGFLQWLDDLEDESALAAIAARLSVSSSVSELESTDV
jgi:hypothetical protein